MKEVNRTNQNRKDLLRMLVSTNFKLRYSDSLLGVVWVVMKPLLHFLTLFFVFSAFRGGFKSEDFAANLLIGLTLYGFIQEGVTFGMASLVKLQNIILKVDFPRDLAVLSSVIVSMINFLINLVIIIVLTLFTHFVPNPIGALYFLVIIAISFFLVYGISLYLSVVVIRVRDLENIMQIMFQLLFWASAIFYDINKLEGTVGQLVRMNPVAVMIDASRNALIFGEFTHVRYIAFVAVIAAVVFVTGRIFFNKKVRRIAEHF